MQVGWFVWKVVPTEENKGWSDYLIFNIYANKKQMNDMNSKSPEWWENEIKTAHKGKTKRSIIKKEEFAQRLLKQLYKQLPQPNGKEERSGC